MGFSWHTEPPAIRMVSLERYAEISIVTFDNSFQFYLSVHLLQGIQNLVPKEERGVLGNMAFGSGCPNGKSWHHTVDIAKIGVQRALCTVKLHPCRIGGLVASLAQ